jgi:pimeloyl-ACP methyl ester carboxylesterase
MDAAARTGSTTPALPDLPGVTHRFLDAGGLRVHVAEAGSGEPLVMLHGWPQNWFAYRFVIGPLAERFRVICPDLRGFGWTEAPPEGYAKRQLVADLFALLDALDLSRPIRLVGHDWGSLVGFLACRQQPDRFSRYLVLGGWYPWPRPDARAAWAFRRFWYQPVTAMPGLGPRSAGSPAFLRLLYRTWSASPDLWSEAELEALLGQFADPARRHASSMMYRLWLTRELPALTAARYRSARRVETPTLLLHGAADGCIDPAYTRGRRDVDVELLSGVGHFVPEEAPDVVIARAFELFG